MAKLYNLARMTTATSGTGTLTLGASVSGYLSFSAAGAVDGDVIGYAIIDGTNSEIGVGTYTASGTTLSRTVTRSTNSNSAISLSGTAQVIITARAEDIVTVIPGCGRLTYTSTTALKFAPCDGDMIMLNGSLKRIPSAGIAGLGSPTSVFLDGVAAQTLVTSQSYFIYMFDNSGTLTADFSTTGHATSTTAGNVGTEIKSGDNTRTLIGMTRTGGTVIYASDIQTTSWFNRRTKTFAISGASSGTPTPISFMTWADEAFRVDCPAHGGQNANASAVNTIQVDGSGVGTSVSGDNAAGSISNINLSNMFTSLLSEGSHTSGPAFTGGMTASYWCGVTIRG